MRAHWILAIVTRVVYVLAALVELCERERRPPVPKVCRPQRAAAGEQKRRRHPLHG
jgi:hypothetical protein